MRYPGLISGKEVEYYRRDNVIERAIFEVLSSSDMRPGDFIDIIFAQHQTERKGINRNKFSAGLVQLADRGLLDMFDYRFYLTDAGFDLLHRTKAEWFTDELAITQKC